MRKFKELIALTAVMALCASSVGAQEYDNGVYHYDNSSSMQYHHNDDGSYACPATDSCEECPAYCDSGKASGWSAAIPVGAVVIAAILISSNRSHHSKHSSGGGGGGKRHRHHSSSSSISHN